MGMDYRKRDFELKLGKLGMVLFTLGISCLLLVSFIFGVMVGLNIESAPEDIARGIPRLIKQKIARAPEGGPRTQEEGQGEEARKALKEGEKGEFKLSYYDTLTKKSDAVKPSMELKGAREPSPRAAGKAPAAKGKFILQVASLQDRTKAEELRGALIQMGYDPFVDVADIPDKGKWYRVKLRGFETREDARRVGAEIERKIKGLQCLVALHESG
jgi:cell division septation protein DedD